MTENGPLTSGDAGETGSAAPRPGAELVGPGVPADQAGEQRCGACGRALPHEEARRGTPRKFCAAEHTQWQVPDRVKGGTKLIGCREVAAAWALEADTRGRADAPGPPIDLLGLGEQVAAWQAMATQVLGPAQALADRATAIQDALAGDVAAGRRAVEAAVAQVRDMRGQVEVAEASAEAAAEQARRDRQTAAAATADAAAARRAETAALAAQQRATGALEKEAERRTEAETKRDAAVQARERAETENYALATTITEQRERINGLETAARETASRQHEEIGRLHSQHIEALAGARSEYDRMLAEQLGAERTRLADELARATAAHTAELARLGAELDTARAAAEAHATTIGQLNRDLGAAGAAATAAQTRAAAADTARDRLHAALAELLADPPDQLPQDRRDRLTHLLTETGTGEDR